MLELKPYKADEDGKACVVRVTFDKTGKTATISESGCLFFHGAACAFEGKLTSPRCGAESRDAVDIAFRSIHPTI